LGTSAYKEIKELLETRGITVIEQEFYCRGQWTLLNRSHPNAEDLAAASEFAIEILNQYNIERNKDDTMQSPLYKGFSLFLGIKSYWKFA
jgi:hypothetical protein